MFATLDTDGERWTVRFTRHLPHPPEKVWRALTEPAQLAQWFPTTIEGEWVAGAALRFAHRGDQAPPFEGELVVFDPPVRLEFWWGPDLLRFTLRPDGAGCVLELSDTFDELGKAARDAAGWHTCLDKLDVSLAGETPPWNEGEHWGELNAAYTARLGAEAATIGPPEGF